MLMNKTIRGGVKMKNKRARQSICLVCTGSFCFTGGREEARYALGHSMALSIARELKPKHHQED